MEWQDIATAPKDGTQVLCFWPRYVYNVGDEPERVVAIGWYATNSRLEHAGYWRTSHEQDDYGLALPDYAPTHWAPIPSTDGL